MSAQQTTVEGKQPKKSTARHREDGLLPEDRDISLIVEDVRLVLMKWKAQHPEEFTGAVGEIAQGKTSEPYFMVRTLAVATVPDFDRIPKVDIINGIRRLDRSEIKFIFHRHEETIK